jgi:hypothetical protein
MTRPLRLRLIFTVPDCSVFHDKLIAQPDRAAAVDRTGETEVTFVVAQDAAEHVGLLPDQVAQGRSCRNVWFALAARCHRLGAHPATPFVPNVAGRAANPRLGAQN